MFKIGHWLSNIQGLYWFTPAFQMLFWAPFPIPSHLGRGWGAVYEREGDGGHVLHVYIHFYCASALTHKITFPQACYVLPHLKFLIFLNTRYYLLYITVPFQVWQTSAIFPVWLDNLCCSHLCLHYDICCWVVFPN